MRPINTMLVIGLVAVVADAWGQSGGQAGVQAGVIEEIVVTAEKRTSTAQETAIAITAYTNEMLDLRGINGIEDLQFSTPNLVISHNSQSPVTYAYIRAIGSDQLVAGFDPGVAYNIDGIYVGQPSSMPGDMWDMERVEVLRGPQGTLYGRNTTGGSINLITKAPAEEFDARADVTLGNFGRQRLRAAVGGGNSIVQGRLSILDEHNDGYQKNAVGADGDLTDHQSMRGKLRFAMGERTELTLTGQRFENDGRQSQRRREPFGPVELAPGFILNVFDGAPPNPADPRRVAKDFEERLELENDFFAAHFTTDFDNFTFRSITGYITNEWFQSADIDMSSNPVQFQEWMMDTKQLTQEFQLVSSGEGPWEWIVGAFFFDEELETHYMFEDSSVAGFTFMNGGDIDTESIALFGQAGYDFRHRDLPLKLVAGLRWTEDEKSIDEYQQIPQFAVDLSGRMSETWDEVSGKLELDWFILDDVMGYASYSRGYKGGGFSVGQFDAFDPETVDAFEVGLKSQFWDNRAQVNVSAFYNDYQDLQVNFLVFTLFTTDNAAEASIQGLELETTLVPTEYLTLHANITWLDATFDKYQFAPAISLNGDTLNRAPETTIALSAQYDIPLRNNLGSLTLRADYYWQDEVYYRVQNIDRHREESFHTADLRMIWTSAEERWTVDVFAKNMTDEDNLRGLTVSDGLSTGNNSFESYYPPRTYGVRLGISTGGETGGMTGGKR